VADNFSVEPVVGVPVKTFRSDQIGGIDWPASKVAWGADGTANETDDAAGKRLPVKVGEGLSVASVVAGQISLSGVAAALSTVAARRFTITAHQDNTDNIYIGPSGVTTANGYQLWPGRELKLELSNLNVLFAIVGSGTQKLSYLGEV
jgi:hypothetical protein